MKILARVGFWVIGFTGLYCHSFRKENLGTDKPVNLKYTVKMDLVNPNTFEVLSLEDSTFLSYYREKIVMKVPVAGSDFKQMETDSGIVFSDSGQPIFTHFDYLIFSRGDSIAMLYSFDEKRPVSKVNADSVWRKRISVPVSIVDSKADSLLNIKMENGVRTELYFTKVKPDESYPDSTILSFSNASNGVPFSFSNDLDSTRKMKLFNIQMVYKAYFDPAVRRHIPRREFKFEIVVAKEDNDVFVKKLLKL